MLYRLKEVDQRDKESVWQAGLWFLRQAYCFDNSVALLIAKIYLDHFGLNSNEEQSDLNFIKPLFGWILSALLVTYPDINFMLFNVSEVQNLLLISEKIDPNNHGSEISKRLNDFLLISGKQYALDGGIIAIVNLILQLAGPFATTRAFFENPPSPLSMLELHEQKLKEMKKFVKEESNQFLMNPVKFIETHGLLEEAVLESAKIYLVYLQEEFHLPDFIFKKADGILEKAKLEIEQRKEKSLESSMKPG